MNLRRIRDPVIRARNLGLAKMLKTARGSQVGRQGEATAVVQSVIRRAFTGHADLLEGHVAAVCGAVACSTTTNDDRRRFHPIPGGGISLVQVAHEATAQGRHVSVYAIACADLSYPVLDSKAVAPTSSSPIRAPVSAVVQTGGLNGVKTGEIAAIFGPALR